MRISEGISMLEIAMHTKNGVIYPTLLWDDENVIIIDIGMPGQLKQIQEAIKKEGVSFERLNKVIITHQDLDHTWGLYKLLKESKNSIEILTHEDEKPYLQGEKNLVRLNQRKMAELILKKNPPLKVNATLKDDDELPYSGGIKIIHTPGHTPGHICIYHKKSKTLIVGDALRVVGGQLIGPRKKILDEKSYNLAIKSLKKLKKFDIEKVISYHGGLFTENPNQRIREIIN
ncbi:MAG: MBL fold metallo-hydrolase [Methanobacterium sp.]|nr:MBL fold metallo-hydrolase [Methanobacterium sp.]